MMMYKKLNTVFLLCLALMGSLYAQHNPTNVMTKPGQFAEPKDYYDGMKMSPEMERYVNANERGNREKWVVYSDRENNPLYDEVDGKIKGNMAFMDAAYVVDSKGDWLQLIKYNAFIIDLDRGETRLKRDANPEELGWVRRENLLLWDQALKDPRSGVEKKVVLISTDAEGVLSSGGVSDTIPIWGTSQSKYPRKGMLIYSFFYVLKKEGDMYLIAQDAKLSAENKTTVKGWVSRFRASEWNTRIALEPNIDLRAYNERKKEANYHVAHYQDPADARTHAKSGVRQQRTLMTVSDPVTTEDHLSPVYSIERNKDYGTAEKERFEMKRFDGNVLRFPVLGIDKGEGLYYQTTVVDEIRVASLLDGKVSGSISETTLAISEKASEEYRAGALHWNVVLLIEGTAALLPYRDRILQVVDEIESYVRNHSSKINLRMGAVVYRDVSHEQSGKLTEYKQKGSVGQLRPWLEQVRLYTDDPTDDDRSAMDYGLQQALSVGGFAEDQVNILVHLGAGGDVSRSAMRARKEKGHPAFLSQAAKQILEERLPDLEVSVLSLQIRNEGGLEHDDMLYDMRNTLMVSAQNGNKQSRKVAIEEIDNMPMEANPSMPSPGESPYAEGASCRLQLKGGRMIGYIFSPGKNASISSSQISRELGHFLEETRNHVERSRAEVSKVLSEGRSLDEVPSEFQDVVINQIRKNLVGKVSRNELEALRHLRFRLMQQSYVPAHVAGMKHNLLTYVVLMDRDELSNTINRLDYLTKSVQQDSKTQRERLFNALLDQCNNTYLGNVSRGDFAKMDYNDLARMLLGIAEEGIILPTKVTWNLGEILNDKKVTKNDIYYYITHLESNLFILREHIQRGSYPYKFERNGVIYYWVPVEFTI